MNRDAEQDFIAFVAQRGHALMRTAYALAGDRHTAEDLVQSALAKTASRWASIRGEPEPYVRRALYREFVSGWRHRRRRPELVVPVVPVVPDRAVAHLTAHPLDLGNSCYGAHCVGGSFLTGTDNFTARVDNGSPGSLTVFDTNGDKLGTISGAAMSGTDLSADQLYIVETPLMGGADQAVVLDRSTGAMSLLNELGLDLRTVRWIDATHFLAVTHGQVVELPNFTTEKR